MVRRPPNQPHHGKVQSDMGTNPVSHEQAEIACVFSPVIYRDPLVRLALELKAVYASWGAGRIAPGMNGLQLALRLAAVRLELPGLPGWWAAVPAMRDVDMILYLYDGESPGEQFFETFPPFAPLRTVIEDAAAALAAQEAAI